MDCGLVLSGTNADMHTRFQNPGKEETLSWLHSNALHRAVHLLETTQPVLERDSCVHDVIVCTGSSEDTIGYSLACIFAGKRMWIANPHWKAESWKQVSRQVQPDLVLGDACPLAPVRQSRINPPTGPEVFIPTGGSSGSIRFARHNLGTLSAAMEGAHQFFFVMDAHDARHIPFSFLCLLPLWHTSGWMQFIRAWLGGGRWMARSPGEWEPESDLAELAKHPFQVSFVPTLLQRLLRSEGGRRILPLFSRIYLGGAACTIQTLKEASSCGANIWATYGLTETAGMIAGFKVDRHWDDRLGAAIFPHAEVSMLPAREHTLHLPHIGHPRSGEILIKARSLCLGYGLDPLQLDENGWFHTRDEGSFCDSGRLHVVGRLDRIIISGGEKIDPNEVRAMILEDPRVSDAWIGSIPDPEWGRKVVALWVPHGVSVAQDEAAIGDGLRKRIEAYKIPKLWKCMESIPRDEKGKLSQTHLEALFSAPSGCDGVCDSRSED